MVAHHNPRLSGGEFHPKGVLDTKAHFEDRQQIAGPIVEDLVGDFPREPLALDGHERDHHIPEGGPVHTQKNTKA